MPGSLARELANEIGLCGIEPAQQLVQRAEHLLGQRGRDCRLCLPALFEQRGKPAIARHQ